MSSHHKLLCLAVALVAPLASAQTGTSYPTKPIRILVPFAPGGGTDVTARIFGQKFMEAFGHNVVVDNRPGAGGNIGTELAARATPDGHTLLMTVSSHSINVSLYRKIAYDPVKDFAPVSLVAMAPSIFVAHPAAPFQSMRDLIAAAKAKPGGMNYASPGSGTPQHLAMELFNTMAGLKIQHVPFNGGGPSTAATVAGQVQLLNSSLPSALTQVRAGRLKPLAVTSPKRTPLAPDIPTVAESTPLTDYEADVYYGLFAPAGTPAAIVRRLNAEIERAIDQKDVRERLIQLGFDPRRGSPEQFGELVRAEIVKWAKVVKESGARAD